MKEAQPSVAAIVLNYLNYEKTLLCVQDLLNQDYPKLDVIVVDNCSPNDSKLALESVFSGNLGVSVVATEKNLGYAGGNNYGARWRLAEAPVDYFLIANNDVRIPDRTTVRQLVTFAESMAALAAVGPKVILPSGWVQGPYGRPSPMLLSLQYLLPPLWYVLRRWRQQRAARLQQPQACYRTIGAFLVLKAQIFQRVGMFDEHTFLEGEEDILAEKFRNLGVSFYYFPGVTVVHNHGRSASVQAGQESERFLLGLRGLAYYFKHYRGVRKSVIAAFLGSGALYARIFLPWKRRLGL